MLGQLAVAVVLAAVTVGCWSTLLGWNVHKHVNADGNLAGPYEAWQVVTLGAILAVGVAVAAGRGYWMATFAVPLTVTTCFIVAAVSDESGDGLWPIGALLLLAGSAIATFLLASWAEGRQAAAPRD